MGDDHDRLARMLARDTVERCGDTQNELRPVLAARSEGGEWLSAEVGQAMLFDHIIPQLAVEVANAHLLYVVVPVDVKANRGLNDLGGLARAWQCAGDEDISLYLLRGGQTDAHPFGLLAAQLRQPSVALHSANWPPRIYIDMRLAVSDQIQ